MGQIGADPQVGEGGADAGAAQGPGAEGGGARYAGLDARHLYRQQGGVDPGQDGDVAGADTRPLPAGDDLHGQGRQPVAGGGPDGHRPRTGQRALSLRGGVTPALRGTDRLLEAPVIVGEEVAGGVHQRRGTPVVDLERMVGGTGEVAREVDQELGRRPRIAVDDLVVVADPEAVEARRGEQPDHQQVGRGEVLELVDEHAPAPGLGRRSGVGIGQEDLDGPVDLLVEVDRSEVGQRRPVATEPVGDARCVGDRLLHGLRPIEPEPDGGKGADEGGDRVGIGLAADLEELL